MSRGQVQSRCRLNLLMRIISTSSSKIRCALPWEQRSTAQRFEAMTARAKYVNMIHQPQSWAHANIRSPRRLKASPWRCLCAALPRAKALCRKSASCLQAQVHVHLCCTGRPEYLQPMRTVLTQTLVFTASRRIIGTVILQPAH